MEERTSGSLARHAAGLLLEYLRGELGDCDFAEPPVPLAPGNQTVVHATRIILMNLTTFQSVLFVSF